MATSAWSLRTSATSFLTATATGHLQVASYDPTAQTHGIPVDLPIQSVYVTLVATNDGFLLITGDYTMQHFDLHGAPIGPPVLHCCQPVTGFAAASNGSDVAVLWYDGTTNLRVTMASWASAVKRNVAASAAAQSYPAVAGSGSDYLVAWLELDGVYEGRLSSEGDPLDGTGRLFQTLVPPRPYADYRPPPSVSVAFDGTSYLLSVWHSYDPNSGILPDSWGTLDAKILTARIDPATGAILTKTTICGTDMRIASNGSSTVAAWVDCTGGLDLAFLDANGALASMPVTVTNPHVTENLSYYDYYYDNYIAKPSLAWNGTEWLVTWEEQEIFANYNPYTGSYLYTSAIRGARFSDALTAVDTLPIPIATNLRDFGTSSRLASDGHDFVLVWSSYDDSLMHLRHISASGSLLEENLAVGNVQDLLWNGVSYARIDLTNGIPVAPSLLLLSSSGTVLDSFAIGTTPDDERYAALVSPGTGLVLAAYTRVAYEPLFGGVERVFIAAPRPARGRAVGITP